MTDPSAALAQNVSGSTQAPVIPAYLAWTDDAGIPHQFQCFVKSEDYDFGADITEHPVETGSSITDNVRVKLREAKITFFETNAPIDSNNWITIAPTVSVIVVPNPPTQLPAAAPLNFNAWDNLITERALAATATGAIGNLLGGAMGGAVGTLIGEVGGDIIVGGGRPDPQVVFPPPPQLSAVAPPAVVQSQALGFPVPQDFVQLTISLLQQLLNNVQVVDLIAPKLVITDTVIQSIHIHRDADTGDAAEIEVGLKEVRFVSTTTVPAPAPTLPRVKPPVNGGEQGTGDASPQTESVAHVALGMFGGVKGLLGIGH